VKLSNFFANKKVETQRQRQAAVDKKVSDRDEKAREAAELLSEVDRVSEKLASWFEEQNMNVGSAKAADLRLWAREQMGYWERCAYVDVPGYLKQTTGPVFSRLDFDKVDKNVWLVKTNKGLSILKEVIESTQAHGRLNYNGPYQKGNEWSLLVGDIAFATLVSLAKKLDLGSKKQVTLESGIL
jgi:hypothetical protein